MRLSTLLSDYAADPRLTAMQAREMESAGVDMVWLPEAYGFDAISLAGYIAALTTRIEIGTAIINVYSRTPALIAMSAAGVDQLSGGRFNLGLGASGPQVIEGLHGVPYEKPMRRIEETIAVCRELWRREGPLVHRGSVFDIPLAPGRGTGLGKPLHLINHPERSAIPVYWAALRDRSVESTAALADGWLPTFYMPAGAKAVFGDALRAGRSRRSGEMAALQIVAGGPLAIGEGLDVDGLLDLGRPQAALYIGGMGARGHNFYNELICRYGFEHQAKVIQDLYLDGHKREAEAAVPRELLEQTSLIGSPSFVAERVAAYADSGVTALNVNPVGPDPLGSLEAVRQLIDHAGAG